MEKYEFVAEKSLNGSMGWRPLWTAGAYAVGSHGVAHDIIDHNHDTTTGPAEEFRATGAAIHTRKKGDLLLKLVTPSTRDSVAIVLRDSARGEIHWPTDAPPADGKALENKDVESEIIHSIVDASIVVAMKKGDGAKDIITAENLERMAEWMREGYRGAVERFGDNTPQEIARTFLDITEDVDDLLDNANTGDRMTVEFDPKTLAYSARAEG